MQSLSVMCFQFQRQKTFATYWGASCDWCTCNITYIEHCFYYTSII